MLTKVITVYQRELLKWVTISILYGLCLSRAWNLSAFLALIIQFFLLSKLLSVSRLQRLYIIFLSQFSFMFAASLWFRNIDALGWQSIAGLPPAFWLMLGMAIVCVLCSLVGTLIFALCDRYVAIVRTKKVLTSIYLIAMLYMVMELARSIAFSVIVHKSGMPIEPSWNLYSTALLVSTNSFGLVGRTMGLFGTSFVVYFTAASLALIIRRGQNKTVNYQLVVVCMLILVTIYGLSFIKIGGGRKETLSIVVVSQTASEFDYLQKLKSFLQHDGDVPTIVVLPEYSNLLHPLSNAGMFSLNYDARYEFPEKFKGKNIYFSGTELEYAASRRYAESYLVNGQLHKLKRQVKSFLIPGGEYIPPWIKASLSKADKNTVAQFTNSREREVISLQLPPEASDNITNTIAISACSELMKPYSFQRQTRQGAYLLTSNVSFEQFTRAPEYQNYANRLASFSARSLRRPLAIGARDGQAVIFDTNGHILTETKQGSTKATLKIDNPSTLYTYLGDRLILFLLAIPAIGMLLFTRIKKEKK